jgi:hypothetical protein
MSRIISFATGTIRRWDKSQNRNDLLTYVKKLKVDGVEITFASKEELYAFKLSKQNEKWLKGLKYVTIHAPFKLVRKARDEEEVMKQLKFISGLYIKIKAKNVIIHPRDLPQPETLKMFKFKVSTENLPKRSHVSIFDLERIFKKYPRIGLCLDASHAYLWSKHEARKLVAKFGKKITQIHFSGTYRNKEHQSIRIVTKGFLYSIKPVFLLSAPVVIEGDTRSRNKKLLKEEVEYIKHMFKDK